MTTWSIEKTIFIPVQIFTMDWTFFFHTCWPRCHHCNFYIQHENFTNIRSASVSWPFLSFLKCKYKFIIGTLSLQSTHGTWFIICEYSSWFSCQSSWVSFFPQRHLVSSPSWSPPLVIVTSSVKSRKIIFFATPYLFVSNIILGYGLVLEAV